MFRKFLSEVRSAACRSRTYAPRTDCAERMCSNSISLHLSYAEYSGIRKQCSETNHHLIRGIRNKQNSSLVTSSFSQPSSLEKKVKICRSAFSCFEYQKLSKNTSNVWTPLSRVLDAQQTILPSGYISSARYYATNKDGFSSIRNRISSLHAKKRTPKKKKHPALDAEEKGEILEGFAPTARHKFLTFDPDFDFPEVQAHRPLHRDWQVIAYATADEYDLNGLLKGLTQQGLYTAAAINPDAHDVLHMVATYRVGSENREIYFFREGAVVFWNVAELECSSVLLFLQKYEKGRYKKDDIEEESENLTYTYSDTVSKTRLVRNRIILNPEGATDLEKYTFSNAMAMSVKLGIWEASLDKYIDDIEYVSEELSKTGKVVLSQDQVLQCLGQLCALRHLINLSSDLLDTPDFYWEHENLEQLYQKTSNHLNISKRTSVMNVKLSHCVELMELLKSHLNEQHSARLEWIIIILIMIEVCFEILHVVERWM